MHSNLKMWTLWWWWNIYVSHISSGLSLPACTPLLFWGWGSLSFRTLLFQRGLRSLPTSTSSPPFVIALFPDYPYLFMSMTLCDPVDCSLPGSSVHGSFQASILEWVAISFSRRSSRPRDWTQVSLIIGRHLASEAPGKPHNYHTIYAYHACWFGCLLSSLHWDISSMRAEARPS